MSVQDVVSVRDTVAAVFGAVATEQHRTLAPLCDDTPLFRLGLDSLCLAIIVTRLEGAFGTDPFNTEDLVVPATFGQFVALYGHDI